MLPAVLFVLTCASTFWVGVTKWNPIMPAMSLVAAAIAPIVSLFTPVDQSGSAQQMMELRLMVLENWDTGLIYMFAVLLIPVSYTHLTLPTILLV